MIALYQEEGTEGILRWAAALQTGSATWLKPIESKWVHYQWWSDGILFLQGPLIVLGVSVALGEFCQASKK